MICGMQYWVVIDLHIDFLLSNTRPVSNINLWYENPINWYADMQILFRFQMLLCGEMYKKLSFVMSPSTLFIENELIH